MDGEISAEELQELLEDGEDVRVVDIRSSEAFRRGHIPDSENVPFGELTARIAEFTEAERVVTVCPHGKASQQAARLIGSYEGFSGRVDSLKPGIEGWVREHDLEVEQAEATAGGTDRPESDEGPDAPF